jgi:hypothetical protein
MSGKYGVASPIPIAQVLVMQFTRQKPRNWRNFTRVDVELRERLFITGPNVPISAE